MEFKDFSSTPPEIQGLFKTVRTLHKVNDLVGAVHGYLARVFTASIFQRKRTRRKTANTRAKRKRVVIECFRFAVASSSLANLSPRSTVEEQYEKIPNRGL